VGPVSGRTPDGYRYTQFVHHFNQWKGHTTKASGILRHQAGEKLFIDFAGKTLSWVDRETGEVHPAQVFVAILPCSQYTYVQAVASQKREDLVRAITDCKSWLGGVTKAIVGDNMKAVVAKGHKYAPIINKTLKDLALHYGCVIDPTRPYHPKDKALVEGAVGLVYQRIYYPLSGQTFFSLAELNQAIRRLLISTTTTGSKTARRLVVSSSSTSNNPPWIPCLRLRTSCEPTNGPRCRRSVIFIWEPIKTIIASRTAMSAATWKYNIPPTWWKSSTAGADCPSQAKPNCRKIYDHWHPHAVCPSGVQ
jgi:hypothetical protein